MNSFERIEAVLALEKPDRVPLSPLLDHWAATYTGLTNARLMQDSQARIRAVLQTAKDFQWDMTYIADTANPTLLRLGVPQRLLLPGVDLPETSVHQFEEKGFLRAEDYDLLAADGLFPFLQAVMERIYPEITLESALRDLSDASQEMDEHLLQVQQAGIVPAVGFVLPGPAFEYFCLGRGITQTAMDLRRRLGKMKEAARAFREGILPLALEAVERNGVRRVFIGMSRSSPAFIPPRIFEELVLPDLEFYVDGLTRARIVPWFHFDTDWTRFLPYFRKFPRAACAAEFDGFTDMVKAREILGGIMAIKGDVPSSLLAFGTRDEVLQYCRDLIQKAGRDGGFILSSGCSIPANARVENVRAMTEAAEAFGRYST